MKKIVLLIFVLVSILNYSQNRILNIDSLHTAYKPYFDKFSQVDSTINELEEKRNKINENLGAIVFERDFNKRNKLIRANISKQLQPKLLKMSTSEIEKMRSDYDKALKDKITLNCMKVELKYREFQTKEMEKSMINYLIGNGYNLDSFQKLSEDEKKNILKNWKYEPK